MSVNVNEKGIVDMMKECPYLNHMRNLILSIISSHGHIISTVSCLFSQARIRPMTPA